jgi:hypothetical protein
LANKLPYFKGVGKSNYLNEKYYDKEIRIYFKSLTNVSYPLFYGIDDNELESNSGSY